jgi:hypothetical protein
MNSETDFKEKVARVSISFSVTEIHGDPSLRDPAGQLRKI